MVARPPATNRASSTTPTTSLDRLTATSRGGEQVRRSAPKLMMPTLVIGARYDTARHCIKRPCRAVSKRHCHGGPRVFEDYVEAPLLTQRAEHLVGVLVDLHVVPAPLHLAVRPNQVCRADDAHELAAHE